MSVLAVLIALGPLTGVAAALAGARARLAGLAQAAGALVAFGCALALLAELDGRPPLAGWDGFLYVDPLGGFFAMTVAGVTLLAALGSIGYVCAEEDSGGFLFGQSRHVIEPTRCHGDLHARFGEQARQRGA